MVSLTYVALPLSYYQLLIGQNCTHRNVSSKCFLPFPHWQTVPSVTRNLASIPCCVCFPFQKCLFFKSNSPPCLRTKTHPLLWVILQAQNPTTTRKPRNQLICPAEECSAHTSVWFLIQIEVLLFFLFIIALKRLYRGLPTTFWIWRQVVRSWQTRQLIAACPSCQSSVSVS